jgi:hypothetical protein
MPNMKKPVVKLTTKVYGEAVKKAFNANQAASKKKTSTSKPAVKRSGTPVPLGSGPKNPAQPKRMTPAPLGTPAPRSSGRRPATPKTTKKAPGKMTKQDAAMKKILEGKYGKIYG